MIILSKIYIFYLKLCILEYYIFKFNFFLLFIFNKEKVEFSKNRNIFFSDK